MIKKSCKNDIKKNNNNYKLLGRIAKGGIVGLLGKIIGRFLGLVLQVLLTRFLGAESYGVFALGQNIVKFVHQFSLLGLQHGVVRYGSKNLSDENYEKLRGTIISTLFLGTISSILVCVFIYNSAKFISINIFNDKDLILVLRIFALSLPFLSLFTIISHLTTIFKKIIYHVIIQDVFYQLALLSTVLVNFLLGIKLIGVICSFVFASILTFILSVLIIYRLLSNYCFQAKIEFQVKKIFNYSITVMMIGFSYIFLTQIDKFMLGYFCDSKFVGIYNVAVLISSQIGIILTSFNLIFSPIIVDLYNKKELVQLSYMFKSITKWILTATLPFFIIFSIMNNKIMFLFGSEFGEHGLSLIILTIAQLINVGVGPVGFMLTMTGHHKLDLSNAWCMAFINGILNFVLIPIYGTLGAAISTGLSIAIINILRLIEVYLVIGIQPYTFQYLKPIFAAIGSIIVLYISKFILSSCCGVVAIIFSFIEVFVVYTLLLTVMGFDESDKYILRPILKQIGISIK